MVLSNVNYNGSPQFTTIGPDQLLMGVLCEKGKIYSTFNMLSFSFYITLDLNEILCMYYPTKY